MTAEDPKSIDRAVETVSGYQPSEDVMRMLKSSYERELDNIGKLWQENCAGVDEVIQALARSLNAEYPSGEEYPDARAFSWTEGSVDRQTGYSISMHLLGSGRDTLLRVYSAAWMDNEAIGVRKSVAPYHVDLATPVRPKVLQGTIEGLIGNLFDSSPALIRRNTLNASVLVIETPLSKLPGQS